MSKVKVSVVMGEIEMASHYCEASEVEATVRRLEKAHSAQIEKYGWRVVVNGGNSTEEAYPALKGLEPVIHQTGDGPVVCITRPCTKCGVRSDVGLGCMPTERCFGERYEREVTRFVCSACRQAEQMEFAQQRFADAKANAVELPNADEFVIVCVGHKLDGQPAPAGSVFTRCEGRWFATWLDEKGNCDSRDIVHKAMAGKFRRQVERNMWR